MVDEIIKVDKLGINRTHLRIQLWYVRVGYLRSDVFANGIWTTRIKNKTKALKLIP